MPKTYYYLKYAMKFLLKFEIKWFLKYIEKNFFNTHKKKRVM